MDTPHPRQVLDLALAIGEILLAEGMSASDLVASLTTVTKAYGIERAFFDVTYTQLSATCVPDLGETPITAFRMVHQRSLDFTRVRALDQLLQDIGQGMPFGDAVATFEALRDAPAPYASGWTTIGDATLGAGVVLLFTTNWRDILLSFLICLAISRLVRLLDAYEVPVLFQQGAGAAVAGLFAATAAELGRRDVWPFVGSTPALLVVGGVVVLVAGITAVGAVLDAIDEFYVTASARMFETLMRTVGIVGGLLLGLRIAEAAGFAMTVRTDAILLGPFPAQVLGAAMIAYGFALFAYADRTTRLLAATMGVTAWLSYSLAVFVGAGETVSNAIGALAATFISTLIVRHTTVPSFALITAALLPLVPGLALYSGLLMTVGTTADTANVAGGSQGVLSALMVALGIAAGASLGTFLGRPIADRVRTRRRLSDANPIS